MKGESDAIKTARLMGLLLVLAGVLILLDNLNLVEVGAMYWGIILAVGGVAFLSVFLADRENWWAIIPGKALLMSITGLILLSRYNPQIADRWGGSIIMGGIGLAFLSSIWQKRISGGRSYQQV